MVSSINQMRDTPLLRKGVNKVALCLFEHNGKAYRAAVRMMEQYGKAAIVHPTGTGKSYIAFKLIEDNPERAVIWLSPSEYLFKTQLESLKRNDPDFPLANVHFYTYAKLMCCTQAQLEKIAAQKPAYIILDEFHRAGAECWGESTVALLKLCPDAKLLGLTATNIRYLGNNCDMDEELFGGHIATDVTIGEAVVRGILPAPKYVTTVYQYQKALAKYQARVDNLRAPGVQDANQKYLDALRRALEQADGLDRVFAHHITNLLRRARRPEDPETVYHAWRAEPWCVAGHPVPCARRTDPRQSDRAADRTAGQHGDAVGESGFEATSAGDGAGV